MTFQDRLAFVLDLDLPADLLPLTIANEAALMAGSDSIDSSWR
ncbi:hypothetical protein [Pelomonas sp. SE-A7]|nr:hypothetical protein [Pelomonas sp. SE-A7]MDM4766165.1 hypothetical protein [Pelomonas sp. SE-A7]